MTSVRRRGRADSADYSDASRENETNFDSSNDGPVVESDYDSATQSDSDLSERENGDGQESERRVDDDEDRSNPQYIPKRGTFYEHDDRTAGSGDDGTQEGTEGGVNDSVSTSEAGESRGDTPDKRQRPRKSDACDKWSHDKFNQNEQAPKSRDELVAIYGYDIRNEDAPPHARRNRRYGRGPTKYTRTWEDEEAYKRANAQAAANRKPQAAPTPEDFPSLDNNGRPPRRGVRQERERPPRSRGSANSTGLSTPPSDTDRDSRNSNPRSTPRPRRTREEDLDAPAGHTMPPLEKLTITTSGSGSNGSTPTPQRKVVVSNSSSSSASPRPPRPLQHNMRMVEVVQSPVPSALPPAPQSIPHSVPPASAQRTPAPTHKQLPPQIPPQQSAAIDAVRGKRYSNLRAIETAYQPQSAPQNITQSLPQTGVQNVPQAVPASVPSMQQPHRYVPEYQPPAPPQHQGSPVLQRQQQLMHQVHRLPMQQAGPPQTKSTTNTHGPSPPHMPPPPLATPSQHPTQMGHSIGHGMPIQHMTPQEAQQLVKQQPPHPVHTHNISGGLAATQAYAPPTIMPAQYMQGGGSGVYAGQAVYAAPPSAYQHQMYQHNTHTHQHQYQHTPSVPPPSVSYVTPVQTATTERPSITYYAPADHSAPPEGPRRPSRAVPIVPPPPPAPHKSRAVPENDNIDRIVDNMFVLKNRPATHASPVPKDGKPELSKSQTSLTETRKLSDASSKEGSPSNIDLRQPEDIKTSQSDLKTGQSEPTPSHNETTASLAQSLSSQVDTNLSQNEIKTSPVVNIVSKEPDSQSVAEKVELKEHNVAEISDLSENREIMNVEVSDAQNVIQDA